MFVYFNAHKSFLYVAKMCLFSIHVQLDLAQL